MAALLSDRWAVLRRSWMALALTLAGALLLGALSLWWLTQARHERWALADELQRLQAAETSASLKDTHASVAPVDFTQRLPATAPVDPVLSELQRAAAAAGVRLSEVQLRPQPATERRLGQTEMNVSLRGRYPQVKQLVGDLLSRYAHVTLQRLAATTTEGADDSEFSMTLTIWARPAPSPATGGR